MVNPFLHAKDKQLEIPQHQIVVDLGEQPAQEIHLNSKLRPILLTINVFKIQKRIPFWYSSGELSTSGLLAFIIN